MTPEQGRAEWQRWASRAAELRRDVERYEALDRALWNENKRGAAYTAQCITEDMRKLLQRTEEYRDALREYAPKVTT